MKRIFKNVLLSAMVAALIVSCTDNMIEVESTPPKEFIGFTSTTTRASIAYLSTLKGDNNGFRVYGTSGDNPTTWFTDENFVSVNGTNNYRFASGKWDFSQSVRWPSDVNDYPMTFYAIYPASPVGFGQLNSVTPQVFASFYAVPNAGSQEDVVVAKTTSAGRPASGVLPLVFNHILSKINMGVIAGTGTNIMVQSMKVENVGSVRAYDFKGNDWSGNVSINKSFTYLGDEPLGPTGAKPVFMPIVKDEATANPVYNSPHSKHLMLMPQTALSWKPQSGVAPTVSSGGYISVLYYMSNNNNEVGYANASEHPDYAALGGGITGPLFVKAGFPLPADGSGNFTWDKGRSYTYNVVLGAAGSCNGYIVDDYYYDWAGNKTALKLIEVRDEGKQVGDKLQDGIIHVKLDVGNWDDESGGSIGPGIITVKPKNLILGYQLQEPATKKLYVECFNRDGTPDPTASWTLSVDNTKTWVRISLSDNLTFATAGTTVTGAGSQPVYVYIQENSTQNQQDMIRVADYYLNNVKAGVISQSFNPNNILGTTHTPPDMPYRTYVGAFWRAEQTGERVIHIPAGDGPGNHGAWTAQVMWTDGYWGKDDGIVLSVDKLPGKPGSDPKIYTNNPGDAEDYQVEGDETIVTGFLPTGARHITFRIGLKSPYDPQANPNRPVRYAKVLLSFANNSKHQIIFLRQGHDADYLLSNNGGVPGTDIIARTVAQRFSPYNLTAPTLDAMVDIPGSGAGNPGKFTDYPTQTGAFFHWANTSNSSRLRWAWNPYTTNPTSAWTYIIPATNVYWDSGSPPLLSSYNETCPPGYRRPNDGTTTGNVPVPANMTISELRQSLFKAKVDRFGVSDNPVIPPTTGGTGPDTDNCMYGYYADGFFDRRPIESLGYGYRTVASGGRDIANTGHLFYNPIIESTHYGASLFFPAGGLRFKDSESGNTPGGLYYLGIWGSYWTSSVVLIGSTYYGIDLRLQEYGGSFRAVPQESHKNYGYNIRCVKQ